MQLMDALPRLIKIFRLKGQLTWKDILSVGIDLLGDVNKDEVSLTHKRCIVLTNPYVIAQLAEYKDAQVAAALVVEEKKNANKEKREAAKRRKLLKESGNEPSAASAAQLQSDIGAMPLVLNMRALRETK